VTRFLFRIPNTITTTGILILSGWNLMFLFPCQ